MKEQEVQKYWNLCSPKSPFKTMEEKGYPQILHDAEFLIKIAYHACYKDMGKYYLVGNNYIHPNFRGMGLFLESREIRKNLLVDKPIIGVLQPIENTHEQHIIDVITRNDCYIVKDYSDVQDIMDENIYQEIKSHTLVRYF